MSVLDQAFQTRQLDFEKEQLPARMQFDALVQIILTSETPREFGFGVDLADSQIDVYREGLRIKAHLKGDDIALYLTSDGDEFQSFKLAAIGVVVDRDEYSGSLAEVAAQKIGALMAYIVEQRC